MRFGIAGAIATVAWLAAAPALADTNAQVFAGGQLDFANYVFLGVTLPAHPPASTSGVAVRALVDTGGYDYTNGSLGTVKANFGGGELDAVLQIDHKTVWSDFAIGVNDTYTGLTPNDTSNPLDGEQVEMRLSLDGGDVMGPWRIDWAGYYGTRLNDYAALLGGTHALSPAWRVGLQAYSEGNPKYSLYQIGPYAGLSFGKSSEIQFSSGEAWESGFAPRTYFKALLVESL